MLHPASRSSNQPEPLNGAHTLVELWRQLALGWGCIPLTLKVFSSLGIALLLIYLAANDQYHRREIWFVLYALGAMLFVGYAALLAMGFVG
jgi:hypothetical protein